MAHVVAHAAVVMGLLCWRPARTRGRLPPLSPISLPTHQGRRLRARGCNSLQTPAELCAPQGRAGTAACGLQQAEWRLRRTFSFHRPLFTRIPCNPVSHDSPCTVEIESQNGRRTWWVLEPTPRGEGVPLPAPPPSLCAGGGACSSYLPAVGGPPPPPPPRAKRPMAACTHGAHGDCLTRLQALPYCASLKLHGFVVCNFLKLRERRPWDVRILDRDGLQLDAVSTSGSFVEHRHPHVAAGCLLVKVQRHVLRLGGMKFLVQVYSNRLATAQRTQVSTLLALHNVDMVRRVAPQQQPTYLQPCTHSSCATPASCQLCTRPMRTQGRAPGAILRRGPTRASAIIKLCIDDRALQARGGHTSSPVCCINLELQHRAGGTADPAQLRSASRLCTVLPRKAMLLCE